MQIQVEVLDCGTKLIRADALGFRSACCASKIVRILGRSSSCWLHRPERIDLMRLSWGWGCSAQTGTGCAKIGPARGYGNGLSVDHLSNRKRDGSCKLQTRAGRFRSVPRLLPIRITNMMVECMLLLFEMDRVVQKRLARACSLL